MIAIHSDAVFVVYDNGHSEPFDPRKLALSLGSAATVAGYPRWPQASHIAIAIAAYLRDHWSQQTVTSAQLSEAVVSALNAIGHADIADAYREMHKRAVVDLEALAIESPSGFDLEFFRLLGNRLDQLTERGEQRVQFCNLRPCVKILTGKRSFRTRCKGLNDEVLSFIRTKLAANLQERPCEFVVSS